MFYHRGFSHDAEALHFKIVTLCSLFALSTFGPCTITGTLVSSNAFMGSDADLRRADYIAKQRAMEDALMASEPENLLLDSYDVLKFQTLDCLSRWKMVEAFQELMGGDTSMKHEPYENKIPPKISRLTGLFPSDFSNLRNVTSLYLQSNGFYGPLQVLDISSNNLAGPVPQSLQRFPSSPFTGNNLSPLSSPPPVLSLASQLSTKSSKLGEPAILGIAIGGCALAFVLIGMEALCSSKAVALRLTLRICLEHR
ncbi:hypothetical protein L2E82_36242 [Cichorium intybus]|uniref:Uncharacterized protein n=1 Tax=Cichorium intybus TaxID=13427 RepID=A0ACB9BRD8_CICIN|nr:hypothetical protein L2E82_36242 [Cichorium intybus]